MRCGVRRTGRRRVAGLARVCRLEIARVCVQAGTVKSRLRWLAGFLAVGFVPLVAAGAAPASRPLKVFILAGQSNMVGWGDSTKLPDDARQGSERVLMFEDGKWQPLRPHQAINELQRRVGLTEFSFGPEISFGQEMAKAWSAETIGIVKLAFGGTSLLAWKKNWSKADADRVKQGNWGSLYAQLLEKVNAARANGNAEIAGFLWLQGGGDMKNEAVAKEYLPNLKALVADVRKDLGLPRLPFLYGTSRSQAPGFDVPDDLSRFEPRAVTGTYPAAQWVLKAQFDAQREIPHSRMIVLREIETHPRNVHYNTAGQLATGRLFAQAFLKVQD